MKKQTKTIFQILRQFLLLQLMGLLCLVACGKPQTPAPVEDENDPIRRILGTYDIVYEGELKSGSITVDFAEGGESGLSYSLYTGPRPGSLNSVDSFDAISGTAKSNFSYTMTEETLSCSVELTFISTDEDNIFCEGICTVTHEDGSLETLTLSGNRIWKIGERP